MTWLSASWRGLASIVLAAAMVAGCASVQLVSAYDPQIDEGLTTLYADSAMFVDKMIAASGTPEGTYERNKDFYPVHKAKIEALTVRAQANRALDFCPSTALVAKAIEAAQPSTGVASHLGAIPKDDCQVVLMTMVGRSFEELRVLHEAQGARGLPPSSRPIILDGGLGAAIRAGITVEIAKKTRRVEGAGR
jgi:hypothetical protein